MGMYDTVRSSYNIGNTFTDIECQTKDIENYFGGTLSFYWIDPIGRLWAPDYRGTHDFITYDKTKPEYNEKHPWRNWEWIPNGNHGRVVPHKITKYIEIYPSTWKGTWEEWPVCRLHFVDGILKDYCYPTTSKK